MVDDEKCPSWDLKRNVKLNESVEIILDNAIPIKEGSNKSRTKDGRSYTNNWHLWFGVVEKGNVWWRDEKKEEKDYDGKVSFFPPEKLNDTLINICNGNRGVKVKITKTAEQGDRGLITVYKAEKLEGGNILIKDEDNFVKDIENLKKDGVEVTEEAAIKMAIDDYKIEEGRAKELFTLANKLDSDG